MLQDTCFPFSEAAPSQSPEGTASCGPHRLSTSSSSTVEGGALLQVHAVKRNCPTYSLQTLAIRGGDGRGLRGVVAPGPV